MNREKSTGRNTIFKTGTSLDLKSKTGNAENQTINFANTYIGTVDDGKDLSSDFFTKGAFPANNDWIAG